MNKINKLFTDNKDRKLLSLYFCAGSAKLDNTGEVIKTLERRGIDMIEVGVPFSDPMADGPVIQEAATKALKNGMTLRLLFSQLKAIKDEVNIPIILMGYLNVFMQYGFEEFFKMCVECGVSGAIIPDLPFADYQELLHLLYDKNLRTISETDGARRDMEDYYTLWAHQIKTPIAAMRLLLAENEDANRLPLAELFKIEQYVDMVLQYVRLGCESSDLLLERCDLDSIIRACLRKYARSFSLKKLSFSFTETNLTVLTDEKWLSFVIEQLFSNSLKYTPSGKISIYAEGERLFIKDTGIGIRPEDLPRVCEKGYTGVCGRADKRSTGIGLYLCKSILSRLGHSLEIISAVGEGTTVIIGLQRESITFE